MEIGHLRKDILLFWIGCEVWVLVPGKKYLETGVILESEFCMVQNPCLSKSHTKFGLQDHPCFRILLAWFLQEFQFNPYAVGTISWQGSTSNCDSRLYLPFLYNHWHTQLPMLIYETQSIPFELSAKNWINNSPVSLDYVSLEYKYYIIEPSRLMEHYILEHLPIPKVSANPEAAEGQEMS